MAAYEPYSTLELGVPTPNIPTPQSQSRTADDDHPPGYFDNIPRASPSLRSPASISALSNRPKRDFSDHAAPAPTRSALPSVEFSKYAIAGCELSKDQTTQTIYSNLLTSDPHELELFIQELIPLPPLLEISIVGKVKEKIAFDIKCNMMSLIYRNEPPALSYVQALEEGENGYRGSSEPTVTPHPVLGGVEGWCRQFCGDEAVHKSFTLKREVHNWNTESLSSRLQTLLTSTKFPGTTTITFPLAYSRITVHTPNPPKAPSRMHSFLSSSGKKKSVCRYEVIKTVWPYAVKREGVKTYAVQSEDAWWGEWSDAIRYAVLMKRKGWVTAEDRMDVAMNPGVGEGVWREKE